MDRKGKNNKFRPGVVCPLVIHGESQPLNNVAAYRFPVLSVYFFYLYFSKVSILPVSLLTTRRPRRWSTLFYRWKKNRVFCSFPGDTFWALLDTFLRRPTKSSAWGDSRHFMADANFFFLSGCHKTPGRRRTLTVLYELASGRI
jgi:hypothetical protein